MWGLHKKNIFHFRLFAAKSNDKIPRNVKKTIFVKQEFFQKMCFYCCAEFQKMNRFQKKLVTHAQLDGHKHMEKHEFIAIYYLLKPSIIQVGKYLFKVDNKGFRIRSLDGSPVSLLSMVRSWPQHLTVILKEEYKLQLQAATTNLCYSCLVWFKGKEE